MISLLNVKIVIVCVIFQNEANPRKTSAAKSRPIYLHSYNPLNLFHLPKSKVLIPICYIAMSNETPFFLSIQYF